MDVDDESSQRPPLDLTALEQELDEKYKASLSDARTYLTNHADIPIDLTIILRRSHFMFSSKTSSTLLTKTKRNPPVHLPIARSWVLIADTLVLTHTKFVALLLSVSSRDGAGMWGTTSTLPFV